MEYTFYKIQVGNECYVGSTKDFKKRLQKHKSNCHNEKNMGYNIKVYKSIREVGWDNIDIMIIDKIIYNSKREAFDMETKYMNMFDAKLNMVYPKRSVKQYRIDNKDKISERDRKYRESNTEMFKERKKEYYDENRDKVLKHKQEYYEANKEEKLEKRKQYYEANKEKILESAKEYRETNKEKMSEKGRKYYEAHKEKISESAREYRESNKDKLLKQRQEYYVNNRQLISQRSKLKGCCDVCGKEMRKDGIRRHKLKCKN